MAITVETVATGATERQVVIACVVDKAVLGQIAARWTPSALPSRWANTVVGWCVDYYKEWKRAPGLHIGVCYDEWLATKPDRPVAELVGKFLTQISDEYRRLKEAVNPEYAISKAADLMQRVRLHEMKERLEAKLEVNDVEGAQVEIAKYAPITFGAAAHLDMSDRDAVLATITAARAARGKPLVTYPDALGSFFGTAFERDSFVAFLGYKKGQKSFWLQDLAWRGVRQGRTVAYFEAGDMSKGQVVNDRFAALAAQRPVKGDPLHPFRVPVRIEGEGTPDKSDAKQGSRRTAVVEYDEIWHKKDLTDAEAADAISSGPGRLRLSCHPNSTLSVPGVEGYLEEWEREDYLPEIVIVDYADILAPIEKKGDAREQINDTWKALRALSQKRNCLVVTASQARRDSVDKWLMDSKDVADDTRKLAHVTAFIGINRSTWDKANNVWRLNWIAGRNTPLTSEDYVWVAGQLDFASPAMVSSF